ncbi:MAG: sensor histidine kinase, partial [bacterium]
VERIVTHWSEANGIAAACNIDALPPLTPDADVIFLRATQEALSNVARHAKASHVSVSLHCVDALVLLSIEDDGRGLSDADVAGAGKMGIAGMRERVRRFGGHVMIESTAGAGTSLTVALPLSAIGSGRA